MLLLTLKYFKINYNKKYFNISGLNLSFSKQLSTFENLSQLYASISCSWCIIYFETMKVVKTLFIFL